MVLGKLGDHIGRRMDPDYQVAVIHKQGKRGRWRWFAYYCPPGTVPPTSIEEARRRKFRSAATCPISGFSTREESASAARMLLNTVGE